MATPGKTTGYGRPFFSVPAQINTDDAVIDLTIAARWTLVALLAHASHHGTAGEVSSNPRHISRHAGLASVQQAEEVRDELLEAGLLEHTDDPAKLYVTHWSFQAKLEDHRPGSTVRRAGQLKRAHAAGSHRVDRNGPAAGCPLCAEDALVDASIAHSAPEPEEAPFQGTLVEVPTVKREPKPGSISEVVAEVRETLDIAVPAADSPFAAYREMLATVEAMAANPAIAGRSKDARGTLLNAVLAHALVHYLGDAATQTVINAANRGAKTMSSDGHLWYIHAAAKAGGRELGTERQITGWLKTVASSSRSDQKAAA